ncbi:rootletin-like, partial [Pongo pygmaeus]|uniref:rootletin-like n=1 Tax=Pongo pygmaeus TaxID=9600 RepID=UPI00300D8C2D
GRPAPRHLVQPARPRRPRLRRRRAKILQYKKRCSEPEQQLLERSGELEQQLLRDTEHNQDLESALIRLEEEQQRSASLAQVNAMLREQLDQAGSANQALSEDIRKGPAAAGRGAVQEVGLGLSMGLRLAESRVEAALEKQALLQAQLEEQLRDKVLH